MSFLQKWLIFNSFKDNEKSNLYSLFLPDNLSFYKSDLFFNTFKDNEKVNKKDLTFQDKW